MSLEKIIRKDAGVGAFSPQHIAWLQTLIRVAFRSLSSVLIFYTENQQNYIYLFPTNCPDEKCPRNSDPISEDHFIEHKAEAAKMLKAMTDKTEFFAMLLPYYKIKIVRDLPTKVKKSEKLDPNVKNR